MIEGNILINKDRQELRKKSGHLGKDVDKFAAELDLLKEKASSLQDHVRQCDAVEMGLISDFDRWIVYYNDVAASRMKELQKRVKQLRKRRIEALQELTKIRPKICLLELRCEILSYKQGEIYWESRLEEVKGRKWKA